MIRRSLLVLALGAGAALAVVGPATGASRTLTLEGWGDRVLAFSGDRLVWTEAATVRVDPRRIAGSPPGATPFDYYRAETSRARIDRASLRFTGSPETPVALRTSIAALGAGTLVPTGDGGFVTLPSSRRLAPPLVACCDADGLETVVDSDGRADAPVTVAATWDAGVVRYVQLDGVGRQTLRRAPGLAGAPTSAGEPGAPGLVALAPGVRAWVDPAAPSALNLAPLGDGPPAVPVVVALPGPALRVWAAPGVTAVAVRTGARVVLLRVRGDRGVRVWAGRRLPRVAVGSGAVAVADGRRVLASRAGAVRVVATGRRAIDAVGVDGRRIAWVERGLRRGARVGVLRLGRTR